MSRLFRHPTPGRSGYAALMLFAVAYLATVALVVAPKAVLAAWDSAESGPSVPLTAD